MRMSDWSSDVCSSDLGIVATEQDVDGDDLQDGDDQVTVENQSVHERLFAARAVASELDCTRVPAEPSRIPVRVKCANDFRSITGWPRVCAGCFLRPARKSTRLNSSH